MTGTGQFPSIDAEPEPWSADPSRWPRIKATTLILAVITAGGVAGWFVTGDPVGVVLAAVCAVVLVCAVAVVPAAWVRLSDHDHRMDASDARLSAHDRDLERLALEVGIIRTRQDNDHATVSVLGQRVEEQQVALGECRTERRNNVLDMKRRTK